MSSADPTVRPVALGEGVCIVVVDRNGPWRVGLSDYLREEGFQVLLASNPAEAEVLLHGAPADLVVVQARNMGGGLNLCRRLSAQDGAPVILVSNGAEEVERIVGLEVGADDFVSQGCSHRELLARIRAVLRRQARRGPTALHAAATTSEPAPVRFASWTLSPGRHEVQSDDGKRLLLTVGDFKLLWALLEHPHEAITRERLGQMVGLSEPKLRSLDVGVSRLRRKLGSTSAGAPVIRTVRGVGYMLSCSVERGARAAPAHDLWSARQAAG